MTTFAGMGTAREQLLLLITTPLYLVVIGLELFLSKLRKQETYSLKEQRRIFISCCSMAVLTCYSVLFISALFFLLRSPHRSANTKSLDLLDRSAGL
jgi:formate hydrogenlyase subunit 4